MHPIMWRLSTLTLSLAVAACASPGPTPPAEPPSQPPVAADADGWLESDAVIVLENQALEGHLRGALKALVTGEDVALRAIELDFAGPAIGLEASAALTGEDGQRDEVRLEGEITLSYSGAGLSWHPRIGRVTSQAKEAAFDAEAWRQRINDLLVRRIVVPRDNRLGFRLDPPGEITFSAGLRGQAQAERRFALTGAYTVAASRVRANEEQTVIVLDLEFVDGVSHCAADFSISRSAFAGRIVNREPRDIESHLPEDAPEWHFFTEVSGARRDLTLVHYWFADGRAVGITELPVEPSARWRTWSTLPITPGTARHVEVFTADRDSGCIVDVGHIQVAPTEGRPGAAGLAAFETITHGFPASLEQPAIGLAEVSSAFLAEAVDASLGQTRFALRFEAVDVPQRTLAGSLDSPAGAEFSCEWRDCSLRTECHADFARCERRQDTRDCSTCLFRNPLNNRCMSERVEEECEERRARANARYQAAWETCMAREESAREACERQGQEALESCTRIGETYLAACESNREILGARSAPLATIRGQARADGGLTLSYSGLHIVGNLARLKGQLAVEPDLAVEGQLQFEPESGLGELGQCIANWSARFQTRIDGGLPARRLTGAVRSGDGALQVAFPAMTVPLNMGRSPLEALLSSRPELYSACSLGLSPSRLGRELSGNDSYFLRGVLPLDLQPGSVRIGLPELSAQMGGHSFAAVAEMEQGLIRYILRG